MHLRSKSYLVRMLFELILQVEEEEQISESHKDYYNNRYTEEYE
jgi:hypothetical protein